MAQWRWAYINCEEEPPVRVGGPTGSVQFLDVDATLTGSESLIWRSSSAGAATLFLTGTLLVSGTVSASSFVVHQTDTISGSTIFGNSDADTHIRTGSWYCGPGVGNVVTLQIDTATNQTVIQGERVAYRSISISGQTSSTDNYIIGFGGSGNIEFRLLSASSHNSGAILVLKDEITTRSGAVTISASAPNTIDNNGAYVLTGSNPAISLYSNGANWFVF